MLRSVALCGPQPARRALPRSAPLPGAVSAALEAPAAGASCRERRAAVRRGLESRVRGHHGQAPRQPLPGGPALARLAQNQGRAVGRDSDRRLHARAGRAGGGGARAAPRAATPPAAQRGALAPVTRSTASEAAAVLEQLETPADRLELAVGGARIKLTNLDRIYWPAAPRAQHPGTTKRDLIRYLAGVARFMLPHLADRPLTMIRMPEGIDGERFFQKHWAQALPEFVESVTVFSEHKDEKHRYLLANNLPTLLWLGQVGTLEFHVWHSRAQLAPEAAGRPTEYASSLAARSEEHTSELQSPCNLVCRLLLEKKKLPVSPALFSLCAVASTGPVALVVLALLARNTPRP